MLQKPEFEAAGAVGTRRFQISVGRCRRCAREWPTHVEKCKQCAAVLGEETVIRCVRVVPPPTAKPVAPSLAVVMALELSRRRSYDEAGWSARMWATVAPSFDEAIRVRPGPAGSIVAAWSLERAGSPADAGQRALALRECVSRVCSDGAELRGGIVVGGIHGNAQSDAVERYAERLALAASPGQWLVSDEMARQLEDRFVLRPAGIVPRWPMPLPAGHRALLDRLVPPVLPSAVRGNPPELVLGRAAERRRLLAEVATASAGRRRVIVVSAPAGGGKSYLLRRVLADARIRLAAGVAFPPLGSRALDPLRALLAELEPEASDASEQHLGEALGQAATRRARIEPSAIVIDDIHWARPEAVAALGTAMAGSQVEAPLAWILSTRTTALRAISALFELADVRVELPPLEPADRTALLAQRLGAVPEPLSAHVSRGAARGNPLYLEHLAEVITRGCEGGLPGTLHEAVLTRLDGLVERARQLTHWSNRSFDPGPKIELLEREAGDWLDRLETSDAADLATIGRYLARLRAVDFELVVGRSLLGMPVTANRRLAWAIERLAAASTDALLDYLESVARQGRPTQAAHEARAAAERAERAFRLIDSERLLAFAYRHDPKAELARERGDVALALGRPHDALEAYRTAAAGRTADAELQRSMARAEALIGDVEEAVERLEALLHLPGIEPTVAVRTGLDLARLRGLPPTPARGAFPLDLFRHIERTRAWVHAGEPGAAHGAIRSLVLTGEPARCAAELIETAALSRLAGLEVIELEVAAKEAAAALDNPFVASLLDSADIEQARRMFIHSQV